MSTQNTQVATTKATNVQTVTTAIQLANATNKRLNEHAPIAGRIPEALVKLPTYNGEEVLHVFQLVQPITQRQTITPAERSTYWVPSISKGNKIYKPVMKEGKQSISPLTGLPMFSITEDIKTIDGKFRRETTTKAETKTIDAWLTVYRLAFLASSKNIRKTFYEGFQLFEKRMLTNMLNGKSYAKGKHGLYLVVSTEGSPEVETFAIDGNSVESSYLMSSTYKGLSEDKAREKFEGFSKSMFECFKTALSIGTGETLQQRFESLVK